MKTHSTLILASLASMALVNAQESGEPGCCDGAPQVVKAGFRDAATHVSLSKGKGVRANPISQLRSATPPEDAMDSKAYKPESIIARSEAIHRGGVATLIPKRAVLHLPEGLRGAIGLPSGVRLVSWAEFYRSNRNWIRTIEVTRDQAEGFVQMSEEAVESFKESRHLIVATYQTGPISVMPLREDESSETDETTQEEL